MMSAANGEVVALVPMACDARLPKRFWRLCQAQLFGVRLWAAIQVGSARDPMRSSLHT